MANKTITLKSLQDRVKTGKVLIDMDYSSIIIKVDNLVVGRLFREGTEISYGVDQLYTLPTNDTLTKAAVHIKGDSISFYKDLFKYSIKKYLNNTSRDLEDTPQSAFFIISNTTFSYNTMINNILDGICQSKSRVRVNPNSKNKIKVWIF